MTPEQEKRFVGYAPEMKARAEAAMAEGKAFCPACASVGSSNCGNFDECDAWVGPDDTTEKSP
jgi:hypothetical protein